MKTIQWLRRLITIKKVRTQLILSIALVHLVLMFMFVFDMVKRQQEFLLQQSTAQAQSVANELAVNASTYIMSNDLEGLERLVKSHSNFPYLKYCMVLSPDNMVLAHTQVRFVGQVPVDSISRKLKMKAIQQTLFDSPEMFDIAMPIKYNNNIIGVARIGFSKEHINENLNAIMHNGAWYILVALLIGTITAIIIGRRLSSGLYKLITTANRITMGDRGMRVGVLNSDELQTLGTAFNQMIDEISANENLLTNVLENLPVGVWILDKNANVKSVNKAGKELWGGAKYVGHDEFGEYKAWFTSTGKQVEPREWGAAIAYTENRAVLDQEMEIETLDKSRKVILNSAIPLKNVNGQQEGIIAINVDITQRKHAEVELTKINRNIGERVKELNCLYLISELSHSPDKKIEEILQDCTSIVPPAYLYPEFICVRIKYQGKQYLSHGGFEESPWRQVAEIKIAGAIVGQLEVFYIKQMPDEDEGPFLNEERLLINSFTYILGEAMERKQTELAVREAELKFRSLVEKSQVGVYILQSDKLVYVNPQISMDSGFSEAELFTKSVFDIILPDDWPIFESNMAKRELGEADSVKYEVRVKTKENSLIWLEIFGSVTVYNGATAMIGTMVNITDRKNATAQLELLNRNLQKQALELATSNNNLEQSKQQYSELFNFSPLPAWVADADTLHFLDVNNAAVLHYGYSRDEFLSMTLREIRPVEEIPNMRRAVAENSGQQDGAFSTIMIHQKKNGELIKVEIQFAPVHYLGVKANIAIASDITERLKHVTAIEAQNTRLREISWIQSHIVRAPLTRIMGLIPMLEITGEIAEEQKTMLDYILTSAHELDEVIKTITDKSRIEDFQFLKSDINNGE